MGADQEILESRIISLLSKARNENWSPDEKKRFGALIVLSYDLSNPEHVRHVAYPMKGIDYFKGKELSVMRDEFKDGLYDYLARNPDGAVLIDANGKVIQNDTCLVPNISKVVKEIEKRYGMDYNHSNYERFGFLERVGMRHCFVKAITYELGIRAITLSQSTGTIRAFDRGYTTKVFTVSPELNPNVNLDVYDEIEEVPEEIEAIKIVAPKRTPRYISPHRKHVS